jgi:hypothetical protein
VSFSLILQNQLRQHGSPENYCGGRLFSATLFVMQDTESTFWEKTLKSSHIISLFDGGRLNNNGIWVKIRFSIPFYSTQLMNHNGLSRLHVL